MPKNPTPPKVVPGPKPDTLKIEGDWKEAIKTSLNKKKPSDGWPKENDEKVNKGS
jgi:hypothetical protein